MCSCRYFANVVCSVRRTCSCAQATVRFDLILCCEHAEFGLVAVVVLNDMMACWYCYFDFAWAQGGGDSGGGRVVVFVLCVLVVILLVDLLAVMRFYFAAVFGPVMQVFAFGSVWVIVIRCFYTCVEYSILVLDGGMLLLPVNVLHEAFNKANVLFQDDNIDCGMLHIIYWIYLVLIVFCGYCGLLDKLFRLFTFVDFFKIRIFCYLDGLFYCDFEFWLMGLMVVSCLDKVIYSYFIRIPSLLLN
eukprot:gene2410-1513_t